MQKIELTVCSKLKDENLVAFFNQYRKRLNSECDFSFIELPKLKQQITHLQKIGNDAQLVVLDEHGKQFDSVHFANFIGEYKRLNINMHFIIGEASGFDDELLSVIEQHKNKTKISISSFTTSYQICVVLLAEQIYRAHTILNNHPYHKV